MKKITCILLLLFISLITFAQQATNFDIDKLVNTPPNPPKLVNDYANILTADQSQALERKLVQFDDSTTNQVLVVIVPNLGGKDIADVALDLGRKWGVGNKKSNNGVILLISVGDRKLNISPGYGLEKALPDVTCAQIIDNIITPDFKGNDYYSGINQGTDAIIQATKGEFKAPENYNKRGSKSSGFGGLGVIIIIVILLIIFIAGGRGGGGGGSFLSNGGAFLIGSLLGGGGRGGFGDSDGGGSSGDGGFGGFGGGSFGGGGSSGSW